MSTQPPAPSSTQHPVPSTQHAYLAWALVCLVWGTTYLAIRIALETIPPFLMGFLRWVVAGFLLIAILKARGARLPGRDVWPSLAILGILLIGVGNGAVVWAEQTVPSGLTAVLVSTVPFWMISIERFMPNADWLTTQRVAGLAVGFAGIVLLVWPAIRLSDAGGFLGGVMATQIACLGWAVGSSYSRRRGRDENVLGAAAIEMICAGLGMGALALVRGESAALHFNARTMAALLYLTIVGSIVGFSAYAYALKHLPLATVSLYAYVNPVIAVVLGTIILREPFNARIAIAGAVVLAGMAMVRET